MLFVHSVFPPWRIPIIRFLNDCEYKKELENKLLEEYYEVIKSSGKDRIEELADMLEIIKFLANLEGKELNDIINVSDEKNNKRGSFKDKIYLEKVLKK